MPNEYIQLTELVKSPLNVRKTTSASADEEMIAYSFARWSFIGRLGPPVRAGTGAMDAANSSGGAARASWAAAVEPADVPIVRSAEVTSRPASKSPATMPINQALPVDPPPPRTRAVEEVFMGLPFTYACQALPATS